MRDFIAFLQAVFGHLQTWYGGGGFGGAVVILVGLYERFSDHGMSKRMYAAIFIVAYLFAAFFMAWRDQYHAAASADSKRIIADQKLESMKPKLEGEIEQTMTASQDGLGIAFLQVEIRNIGGSPTIVEKYTITVKSSSGEVVRAIPFNVPSGMKALKFQNPVPEQLLNLGFLFDNTSHPIVPGGSARGWIPVNLPGTKHGKELTQKGDEWIVSFADIYGRRSEAKFTYTGTERGGFQYYPPAR